MLCGKFVQQLTDVFALLANSLQQIKVYFEQMFRLCRDIQSLQLFVPRAHYHVLAVRGECCVNRVQHSLGLVSVSDSITSVHPANM